MGRILCFQQRVKCACFHAHSVEQGSDLGQRRLQRPRAAHVTPGAEHLSRADQSEHVLDGFAVGGGVARVVRLKRLRLGDARLKRESLNAARFGNRQYKQQWQDVVEWLSGAERTKTTRQPALYVGVLDELSNTLNALVTTESEFQRFISSGYQQQLLDALRALPLPPPKDLQDSYVAVPDEEIEARTERLNVLEAGFVDTEKSLIGRRETLVALEKKAAAVAVEVGAAREAIAALSVEAKDEIAREWDASLAEWRGTRAAFDDEQNSTTLTLAASLAATVRAGEALAEHAAASLGAADWNGRAERERRAPQWMRFGVAASFVFAGAVGWFIVSETISNNFDLTVGDGILRAAVIGAFGAL